MSKRKVLVMLMLALAQVNAAHGQYYDDETGMHQNWHRDYDPGTGRYLQSDPIGLEGGMNTYSYAYSSPTNLIDPLGLLPPVNNPGEELIRANVAIAHQIGNPFTFHAFVRSNGPWDFKRYNPAWEAFGNYNYGLTGAASGLFGLTTLLREAGKAQCEKGTGEPRFGTPISGPSYGDDPVDQYWAITGWLDYHSGLYGAPKAGLTPMQFAAERYSRFSAQDTCTNACNIWGVGAMERQWR